MARAVRSALGFALLKDNSWPSNDSFRHRVIATVKALEIMRAQGETANLNVFLDLLYRQPKTAFLVLFQSHLIQLITYMFLPDHFSQ